MSGKKNPQDKLNDQKNPRIADDGKAVASGHGGKVENDFNQTGEQPPTQKNEGQRTANSRHDRESHVGGSNQLQSRRGGPGGSH